MEINKWGIFLMNSFKKLFYVTMLLVLIFAASCIDDILEILNDKTKGKLQITMPGISQSRATPVEADIDRFELILESEYMDTQTKGFSPDPIVLPGETIIFESLVEGYYDLSVKAFDVSNKLIFIAEENNIEVLWANTTTVVVEMQYAPSSIDVSFTFPDSTGLQLTSASVEDNDINKIIAVFNDCF